MGHPPIFLEFMHLRTMRHTFRSEQWLPYPVRETFAFFANPENLPRLMPGWQKARIESASFVAPPLRPGALQASPVAGAGTRMTITFRPLPLSPIRLSWDAKIDEFVWDDHFCDTQLRGPFARWHHCHQIQAESRNDVAGSLLQDEVEYEMPFGPLGELAQRLFVGRQMQSIFAFRHARTAKLLAAAAQ